MRPGPARPWQAALVAASLACLLMLLRDPGDDFHKALDRGLRSLTAGQRFALVPWEVEAVSGKLVDLAVNPAAGLTPAHEQALVRGYIDTAQRAGELEDAIEKIYGDPAQTDPDGASRDLRANLDRLRARLAEQSSAVEAILEQQTERVIAGTGLTTAGVVWPPPRLRFTEPPQLLVVSPRERIERLRSVDLLPDLDTADRERLEQAVAQQFDLSAYVTSIGGYGVWPTMVVDRFGLPWTVETIAHEWVHNYLAFRPLGWAFLEGGEAVTINETVASIVGEELGRAVLAVYYPDLFPETEQARQQPASEPPTFDFRQEMRATRVVVDKLLVHGLVEEAEAYMEARRQRFVSEGYDLRVLNQAYFAFHGSYATGPATTDPIGPKLQRLRDLSPSLRDFMKTVETMTSAADIEAALARLEGQ